jgi:hypothetical protein
VLLVAFSSHLAISPLPPSHTAASSRQLWLLAQARHCLEGGGALAEPCWDEGGASAFRSTWSVLAGCAAGAESKGEEHRYCLSLSFLTVERASQKSPDRVRALETLQNSLSVAATLWWMIRDGLQEELFYSSDDVSVLLNKMNDKPKVVTTKAAEDTFPMTAIREEIENFKEEVIYNQCSFTAWAILCASWRASRTG